MEYSNFAVGLLHEHPFLRVIACIFRFHSAKIEYHQWFLTGIEESMGNSLPGRFGEKISCAYLLFRFIQAKQPATSKDIEELFLL